MILLMIVLTPILSSQTLKENKKNSENELGIDLTKTYSGEEVNEIISIILEEADISIEKAYKEGYKQATVELEPEIIYWKTLFQDYKTESIKNKILFGSIGFASGLLIGNVTGFTIAIKIN